MEEYFDKIEQYLADAMSEEERSSFEAEVAQNKELREAVEAHRLAQDAMEVMIEDNLRAELQKMQADTYPIQKLRKSDEQGGRVVSLRRYWPRLAVAASVLLLIGFFTFQWTGNNYSDSAIAGNFYQPEDLLQEIEVRGDREESVLATGIKQLEAAQYQEALTTLESIPDTSDFILDATYLKGFGLAQQGNIAQAQEQLQTVIDQKINPNLADKAEWLYLLMYLNAEDTDNPEFKALLEKISNDPDHSYHASAVKLKKQLNSFWRKLGGS